MQTVYQLLEKNLQLFFLQHYCWDWKIRETELICSAANLGLAFVTQGSMFLGSWSCQGHVAYQYLKSHKFLGDIAWWHHQMENFSTLLAFCAGNSLVTCEFPAQRPVTQSFDVFMPPPLDARGIMFSGCPSIRPPSVRPSEAWNTLFWPVHGSVGPPDQPWPFYGMSVRLSVRPSVRPWGEVSGHLPENTWRE